MLIEAKIVEVSLNNSMDLGIQWEYSNIGTASNGGRTTIGQRLATAGTTIPAGQMGLRLGPERPCGRRRAPTAYVDSSAVDAALRGTGVTLPNTQPNSSAISFTSLHQQHGPHS